MILEVRVHVPDLIAIVAKGASKTEKESHDLAYILAHIADTSVLDHDGRQRSLTKDQMTFLRCVFPPCILYNVPRLKELMNVFDLDVETVFVYHTTTSEYYARGFDATRLL